MPTVADFSAYLASPNTGLDVGDVEQRSDAGTVSSIDKKRAVPTFFYAGQGGAERAELKKRAPESAAMTHVEELRNLYELPAEAVAATQVHRTIDNGRGGRIVEVRQKVGGVEVYGMRMSVLMNRENQLVAVAGNLHGSAEPDVLARSRKLTSEQALAIAMGDVTTANVRVEDVDGSDINAGRLALAAPAGGFVLATPARIQQVLYPMPKELISAYHIELEVARKGSADSRMFSYVIAGDDGGILERKNLTVSHSYRVWADPVAPFTPMDGPFGDLSPHPTGIPDDNTITMGLVDRNLVAMNGFNKNPAGTFDPWLAAGATETLGNNVDAYADHAAPTGFGEGDVRGKVNAGDAFDWTFDGALEPFADENQIQSSITQIFYVTNWLHDHYYDSGFNEVAENAQMSNFGRGGAEGDPLLAEAQDTKGAATNNANMSSPSDGGSPRMQMYLWTGPVTEIGETFLNITAPEAIAGKYEVRGSGFGVDEVVTATGAMIVANDAGGEAANPADGCEAYLTDVAGKIAVVNRGNCPFIQKAEQAQLANAAALIIINNNQQNVDELPPLGGVDGELKITIPVLGVSLKTGGILTGPLQEATVTAELSRAGRVRGPFRDGTLDNAIVAHEWGHYFHHRLSNCGGTTQCGGMSEGWGDFVALKMMVRETDNLDGAYAKAAFSTQDMYFGIRRVPYSVDFTKNALTFQHISNGVALPDTHPIAGGGPNAEVHNAGEIWATMLWEGYIALLKESKKENPRYTFAEADRRFSDYMVSGLLMMPKDATYTEARDAILAAAAARDATDLMILADAFARRGAGTGAVAPERESPDLVGIAESYTTSGDVQIVQAEILSNNDCDNDGQLDGRESGTLTITVRNGGPVILENTMVHVADAHGLTFPKGKEIVIPTLGPFESATVRVPLAVSELKGMQALYLGFQAHNDASATTVVSSAVTRRINFNSRPKSTKTDDVESPLVVWNVRSAGSQDYTWNRKQVEAPNTVWFAPNPSAATDKSLESPLLNVGTAPFSVRFEHRYGFESSVDEQGVVTHWDGAVIELSTDGGATWADVTTLGVKPGYGGILTDQGQLPLMGREALVGMSAGYPEMIVTELNFGTKLAKQSVQLRFRAASDSAVGAQGWEIDNLRFSGIVNTPFASIENDDGNCRIIDGTGGEEEEQKDDGGGCATGGSGSAGFGLLLALGAMLLTRRRRA